MSNYSKIVFKKEILDIFRDKKTIIMQIVIPLLIFPVMALVLGFVMGNMQKDMEIASEVVIVDNGNPEIKELLESEKEQIKIVESDNIDKDIKENNIKAALIVDENFTKDIEEGKKGKIEIKYMDSSLKSTAAQSKLKNIVDKYSKSILNKRLEDRGIDPEILEPIDLSEKKLAIEGKEGGGEGMMVFSMIVPMLLAIYAATSSMPAAVDLGAGEKERQTLEPLLTTRASRQSILIGKYLAIVLSSVIGTVASIIGLVIAMSISPDMFGNSAGFSIKMGLLALFLFLSMAFVFSGIELAISFYARNFKEAQTYLSPISFLVVIPAYFTMGIDGLSVPYKMLHIPVVNIILLFKEAIYGVYKPVNIITVAIWIMVYILLSIVFTVKMFRSEKVIFRN